MRNQKAKDIYTAAGWVSTYQYGYLHGNPSRFSAKSAIYTAAGCQHKIAIYTATVSEPIQIYTRQPCIYPLPHEVAIYTAAIQESSRLYTLLQGAYKKIVIYTAAVQEPNRLLYIAAVCINKIVIYTAAVQEPIQADC